MIELTDEDRVLIELARDDHAPSDQDRARVRAALASRLGAAAGLGIAAAGLGAKTTATTAAAAGAKTAAATAAAASTGATGVAATVGFAVAAKAIGAAVLVSVTIGVGATVIHRDRPTPPSGAAALAPKPVPPRRPAAVPAVAVPPAGAVREVQAPEDRPAPPLPARATRRNDEGSAPSPAPAVTGPREVQPTPFRPAPPPPATSPAVADEAALLHSSLVARRSGHPAQALELLDRHAIFYPRGVLSEERDAERALVLADLGRIPEARAAIAEFLRAHPASPLAARLRDRQRLLDLASP